MKKQKGSYREVMAAGLAGLVLTLMPTAGVLPAVAGESVQASRGQDTERPRGEDVQRPRGQDTERPRGEDVQRPRGEETERPHGHNRQA